MRLLSAFVAFAALIGGSLATAPAAYAGETVYYMCVPNGNALQVDQTLPGEFGTCITNTPPANAYIVPVDWAVGVCYPDGTRPHSGQVLQSGLGACGGGPTVVGAAGDAGGHWNGNIWCPAPGTPDFLAINPRPPGDGWVMVETVPGQPCGGWRRVAGGN